MSRLAAWLVHLASLLAGLTGIVYGVMRFVLEPAEEWDLVNHPQEPLWKAGHIVLSPLLLFGCGLIWSGHVWLRIQNGTEERRWTGLALAGVLAPMVLSGYLLQVSEDETLRSLWSWTHGLTGAAWVLLYLLHQIDRDD